MAYMNVARAKPPKVVAVSDVRINARLDAQAAAQLDYLTTTTGMGVSEVVRTSLAQYYTAQRARQAPALLHLTPLIGRFHSGHSNTSSQVKKVVADYLVDKHKRTGKKAPARAVRA